MTEHRLHRQADVLCDLAQKDRGNIAIRVEWNCGRPTVRMPILPVGTSLPRFQKTESLQNGDHFPRLQNGHCTHRSAHNYGVGADEFALKTGLAILKQQFDHLDQIPVQFVQRRGLGVRTRPSRDVPHVQACIGIPLNNGGVRAHGYPQDWWPLRG